MSATIAARPNRVVSVLFAGGAILLGGGLIAALILSLVMSAAQEPSGAMQTLPVMKYTGYEFPGSRASPYVFDNTLMIVFFCLAGLGLLGLAAAVLRAHRRLAVWLIVPGALVAIGGSIGGFAAKRSADVASFLASQPKGLVSNDPSNSLALSFDPSSAHFAAPDYGGFWVGMIVLAVGVLGVSAGVAVAIVKRRSVTGQVA